jgi:hypoxanthine-DNA glycosylase
VAERLTGLPPRIAADCRVLVLGSMPGGASLQAAQYYAHPRNRFWPVMGALYGFDATLPYEHRLNALHQAGVGVWDVIGQCERSGSLDAAIVRGTEVVNPIIERVRALPALRAIALNGGKAAAAFRRHVQPWLASSGRSDLVCLPLPSTSPANAAMSLAALQQAWAVLRPCGLGLSR